MKSLMYVIPLSAIAVLVFSTIAAAQGVLDGTVGTSQGATQPGSNFKSTNTFEMHFRAVLAEGMEKLRFERVD